MSRPNHLGTFVSDMRQARRIIVFRSGPEKAAAHRRFRRTTRQLLRRGEEPATRIALGWYA